MMHSTLGAGATLSTGFSRQQVLEVVLGVAFKTLSNYTNHLVDTRVNEAFSAEALGALKARKRLRT